MIGGGFGRAGCREWYGKRFQRLLKIHHPFTGGTVERLSRLIENRQIIKFRRCRQDLTHHHIHLDQALDLNALAEEVFDVLFEKQDQGVDLFAGDLEEVGAVIVHIESREEDLGGPDNDHENRVKLDPRIPSAIEKSRISQQETERRQQHDGAEGGDDRYDSEIPGHQLAKEGFHLFFVEAHDDVCHPLFHGPESAG